MSSNRRKAMSMDEINILRNMHAENNNNNNNNDNDSTANIILPSKLPRHYGTTDDIILPRHYGADDNNCIVFNTNNGTIINAKTTSTASRSIKCLYERLILIQNRLKRVITISSLLKDKATSKSDDGNADANHDMLIFVFDNEEKLLKICCEYLDSYISRVMTDHIAAF